MLEGPSRGRMRIHADRDEHGARDLSGPSASGARRATLVQLVAYAVAVPVSIPANAILARYLGPKAFGDYNLALVVVNLFALVAAAGTEQIVVRELSTNVRAKWPEVLGGAIALRLLTSTLALLACIVVALVLPLSVQQRELVLVTSGTIFFSFQTTGNFRAIFELGFRSEQLLLVPSALIAIDRIATAILIIVGTLIHLPLIWLVILIIYSDIPFFLMLAAMSRRRYAWSLEWSASTCWSYLHRSWYLFVDNAIGFSSRRSDSLLLATLSGTTALGLYSAAQRLLDPFGTVVNMLCTSFYPALASSRMASRQAFQRTLKEGMNQTLVIIAPVALCLAMRSNEVVAVLYGPKFANAAGPLSVLMIALILIATNGMLVNACLAAKMERSIPWMSGATLALNITANIALQPHLGALGASLALLGAEALRGTLLAIGLARKERTRVHLPVLGRLTLALILMASILWATRGVPPVWSVLAASGVYVLSLAWLRVIALNDLQEILDRIANDGKSRISTITARWARRLGHGTRRHRGVTPGDLRPVVSLILLLAASAGIGITAAIAPSGLLVASLALLVILLTWYYPLEVVIGIALLLPFYDFILQIIKLKLSISGVDLSFIQSGKEGVLVIALASALTRRIQQGNRSWTDLRSWQVSSMLAVGITALATIFVLAAPSVVGLYGLRAMAEPFFFWLVISGIGASERRMQQLIIGIIAVALMSSIFAIYQHLFLPNFYLAFDYGGAVPWAGGNFYEIGLDIGRSAAFMALPQEFGAYLMLAMSLTVSWLVESRRPVYAAALFVLAGGLLVTFQRSSWLGTATAMVSFYWLAFSFHQWRSKLLLGGGIAAAIMVLVILNFDHVNVSQMFSTTLSLSDPSARAHFSELFDTGPALIIQHPFGVGTGASVDRTIGLTSGNDQYYNETFYWAVAIQWGLPGLLLVVLFLGSLLVRCYKAATDPGVGVFERRLAGAVFATTLGFCVASITFNQWQLPTFANTFGLLLGLLSICRRGRLATTIGLGLKREPLRGGQIDGEPTLHAQPIIVSAIHGRREKRIV